MFSTLENFFGEKGDPPKKTRVKRLKKSFSDSSPKYNKIQTVVEKIRQRRAQMLVHSCLYYELDDSVVDDHTWQHWADELTKLQSDYPEYTKIGYYDREFEDWDGSTGMHLPLKDPKIVSKAKYIKTLIQSKEDNG